MKLVKRLTKEKTKQTPPAKPADAVKPAAKAGESTVVETSPAPAAATPSPPDPSQSSPKTKGGKNWRLSISRDKLSALLDYVPKEDLPFPHATEILQAADDLGISPDGLFDSEKVDTILRNAETSGIALRQYPICDDLDGGFEIAINDEKTRAAITINKGRGRGKPLELKEVGAALRTSGLKKLNFEQIKTDILTFYRSTSIALEDYELAVGTLPEKGEDQEISWDVEFMPATELAEIKKTAEEAAIDSFEGLDSIAEFPIKMAEDAVFVKSEQVLATVTAVDRGSPGSDVLGKSIAGLPGAEVGLELHENCVKRQDEISSQTEGIFERWQVEGVFHLRVRPHADASIMVSISEDNMAAMVDLVEGAGTGSRLHAEDVRQALIAAEVIRGIDLDAVEAAVLLAAENGAVEQAIVAQGEQGRTPEEGAITFHVEMASGKGVTIAENGSADYRNQDKLTSIEEGTLIAEIITPETSQADGFDVRGNVLAAAAAKEMSLVIGERIVQERDDEGKLKLLAGASGELAYDGKSIDIVGIHTVQGDVGPATGNIRFAGPVNITGSVLPGYVVMASGEVKIAEGVETSLVSSEKSIHIGQGVKGGGKAAIRARESITAAFAEQVVLMAVNNVTVKNACMQCSIKCNGKLKLETEKGHLVGGQTRCRGGIEVSNLGSKSGSKTQVSFGQDYLIGDKIDLEQKELEKLKEAAVKADSEIHLAEKEGNSKALNKNRKQKVQILKLTEKRTERLFWLREKFEQHFESTVVVRGTAFAGVILESHGRTHEITSDKKKVVFFFNLEKGIIEDRPIAAEEKK